MTQEITDENFERLLNENAKPIVLDFWAPGCGPCAAISPHFEALAKEYQDEVTIGKVDISINTQLAIKFGVRSIPTVLYLKDGDVVDKHVGATTKNVLEERLKQSLIQA